MKMICIENDANCPSYSNKQCTFDGFCSLKREETMKCPKCGEDWNTYSVIHSCGYDGRTATKEEKKPNPSPRDIFQHIKTECERKAFDEFMGWYSHFVGEPDEWDDKIEDFRMVQIKNMHPDWYSWFQHKGLVHKEKVKREAWVNVYKGFKFWAGGTFDTEALALQHIDKSHTYIKTILLHSWEEEK